MMKSGVEPLTYNIPFDIHFRLSVKYIVVCVGRRVGLGVRWKSQWFVMEQYELPIYLARSVFCTYFVI